MTTDEFDVVIIGAGLSGIGAAYYLQEECPEKSYTILEGRDVLGGTWDLFRYPGIRSDSDMHTMGYGFKPWLEAKAIADGPSILNYVQEAALENGIDKHIRFGHQVDRATWSTAEALWTIEAVHNGKPVELKGRMLLMCCGYYSYKGGFAPEFVGADDFKGPIVHPQKWPEELDYKNKKVVIIGSGATAMTLVPALADETEHVVMLQRSPTYVVGRPDGDKISDFLRKYLPEKQAYALTRWKNITLQQYFYKQTREKPEETKQQMLDGVRGQMGPDYDIDTHFTPSYYPWDQRICLVPNSDLFIALKKGKASIVTDQIERFTEKGVLLTSGNELDADIIVTATGLDLEILGGIEFVVDDRPVDLSQTFSYKGIMYSDVPNLIYTFGYINASWTLRSDLIAKYSCRLIKQMDAIGAQIATPRLRPEEQGMEARPWIVGFSSNYVQRKIHLLPKQGPHEPWINPQNYKLDKKMFLKTSIEDGVLQLERAPQNVGELAS